MPTPAATTPPSAWVTRYTPPARDGATALDLACGGGRHGRWLLAAGYAVTLLDKNTRGVADLADVAEVVAADLEDGSPWPLPGRSFDLVVVTNYLHRPLAGALAAAVARGGRLIHETFGLGNEAYGRPSNPDFLLKPGELLAMYGADFTVMAYEQGLDLFPAPRVRQRVVLVRDKDPAPIPPRP